MKFTRRHFIKSAFILAPAALLLEGLWIEKFFIEKNEFYLKGAERNDTNLKFIQVSDLHLQTVTGALKRLAATINDLRPDLILFTGDSIDKASSLPQLDEFLRLLDSSIQKVAILGNWEYWGNVDLAQLKQVYSQHNCTLLVNESVQFTIGRKTVSITGVDDYVGGKADITKAVENYTPGDHHIILNHCPEYSTVIQSTIGNTINSDFILSGHTHGGQINVFGYIPFLPRGSGRFVKGWYSEISPAIYVSKGIGTSKVPARFGARAEIAIFNLPA